MQQEITAVVFYICQFLVTLLVSSLAYRHYKKRNFAETQKYHTFNPRWLAAFGDSAVLAIYHAIITALFILIPSNVLGGVMLFLMVFGGLFYQIILHAQYGQTVGKMICKVKVIDWKSGADISFKQALLRDSIPLVLLVLIFVVDPFKVQLFFKSVYFLWFLAELATTLTNEKRRALHDFIAGTVVVRTNIDPTLIFEGKSIIDSTSPKFQELSEKYNNKSTEELSAMLQNEALYTDRTIIIIKAILKKRGQIHG
jgi:uncharacterized RDD family membrane protein YckC